MTDTAILDRAAGFDTDSDQFLTFTLEDEEYGIEILRVQEIKGYSKIRPIPNAPDYVKGVMNLRGTVVPVIDLRCRFRMPHADYNQFTVIIVVSVGSRVVGLVVDAVSDVLNIPTDQVEETPEVSGDLDTSFFRGMGKVGEKLVLLLNIDKLIAGDRLDAIDPPAA
ncbi:MAG: purine-binding chemotaxis protein CheW [Pirellulales bacterium]|nr:purine-binding chemotaxis protein CheW [Pirellulales bacterium]